jgi:hypothetical protein
MINYFRISTLLSLITIYLFQQVQAQVSFKEKKPRIIITADPELDDNNSLIRLILYSSDLDIEGLVYNSSQFHWTGDGKGTRWSMPNREYTRFGLNLCPCESWRWAKGERFIHDIVEAYEKSYQNLKVHNPEYPTPGILKSKIRFGNIKFDGDFSEETPGSELIRAAIMDDKPGQLYITAWGGQSSIARALKSIQDQYEFTTQWDVIKKKIAKKVVLLPSGDQDDTYANYIKPYWPEIEYRQFSGGPNYGYGAQLRAKPENASYLTTEWMKANVTDRGPLGSLYRVWGDGKQMVKGDIMDYFGIPGKTTDELKKMGYVVWMPPQAKGSWLGEGDNHTFMNMLGNGLRAYEAGFYGGWGGGAAMRRDNFAFGLADTSANAMANALSSANDRAKENPFPDFFAQAQRDFAARMQWAVTPKHANANHAPNVRIEGPLTLTASAGTKIRLNGFVSDPDGNTVTTKWWQFSVGNYPKGVVITKPEGLQTEIQIPKEAEAGQTIHLIFEAIDNGTPSLTKYKRIIITVRK